MTPEQRLASIRLQAPITVAGLRRRAATKTEPHNEDDKMLYLEAAELIEKAAALLCEQLTEPATAE